MRSWIGVPVAITAAAVWALTAALDGGDAIRVGDLDAEDPHMAMAAAPVGSDSRIVFEQVAQLGGAVVAARVVDGIAYVGVGPRLVIVDMTNPESPIELGRTAPLRGLVTDVDVAGHHAFVTHGAGGLSIVDVTDRSAPRYVSRVRFPDRAVAVQVAGDRAFVAAYRSGLRVVSIDDPKSPRELGSVPTGVAAVALDVSGGYAYVAAWTDGLQVVSLADEMRPEVVGALDTPEFCKDVEVVGDIAYVADGHGGLRLVSVTDRRAPVELGVYEQTTREPSPRFYAGGVAVAGEVAYVGGGGRIWVLRVADPTQPSLVGFAEDAPAQTIALRPDESALYALERGLVVYSLSERTQPRAVGAYNSEIAPSSLTSDGGLVLTERHLWPDEAKQLSVVSMADPTTPVVTSHIGTTAKTFSYSLDAGYAYFPEGADGLRIVSLADPYHPVDVGHVPPETEARSVRVHGDYAYLAESSGYTHTLRVIAIDDPTEPLVVASAEVSTHPHTLLVENDHAYVGGLGLSTIWVGDPYRPTEVHVDEQELELLEVHDIQIGDRMLFLWDRGGHRVHLMDLLDRTRPRLAAGWSADSSSGRPIVVSQGLGLLLGWAGLTAFDVGRAPKQEIIGAFESYAEPFDASIDEELVYVAAGAEGLLTLRWKRLPALPEPYSTAYLPSVGLSGR